MPKSVLAFGHFLYLEDLIILESRYTLSSFPNIPLR